MIGRMRRTGPRRRRMLTAALLLTALTFSLPLAADQQLTVVSFGGSYARACQQAYHEPFTEATGIEVRLEDYNGGLAQIRAQVETGNVHWDVVDLNVADAVLGCDEGLLEFIDPGDLPPGATAVPWRRTSCPAHSPTAAWARSSSPPSSPTTRSTSRREAGHHRGLLRPGAVPRSARHAARAERQPGARTARRRCAAGPGIRHAGNGGGRRSRVPQARYDQGPHRVVGRRVRSRRRCWPTARW